MNGLERVMETALFNSRWILAPFYFGLVISLIGMLVHFGRQLVEFILHVPGATESDITLGVLGLIDITFTANLLIIVIFSGYENFVSRIDTGDHDKPQWMAKVDFGGLKQKLMTSIVAISAIQVLKAFMNLDKMAKPEILGWLVGIHVVFLGSMLVLAIVDRLEVLSDQKSGKEAKRP
ncbi:MAG: TIGR00645 family protein [Xanthobacteraceae bacterium]